MWGPEGWRDLWPISFPVGEEGDDGERRRAEAGVFTAYCRAVLVELLLTDGIRVVRAGAWRVRVCMCQSMCAFKIRKKEVLAALSCKRPAGSGRSWCGGDGRRVR